MTEQPGASATPPTPAPPPSSGGGANPTRARQLPLFLVWVAALATVLALQGLARGGEAGATLDASPATLLAPKSGLVALVRARPGDIVKKGDVLAEIDGADVDLEIAVAVAELERLKTEIGARAVEVAGSDFESGARLEIEAERAKVDLATLVADEKRDHAELDALDAQIEKQKELIEKKLASAEQRDQLLLRRSTIAERVADAAAAIATAKAHAESARKRLERWRGVQHGSGNSGANGNGENGGDGGDERTAPERAAVRAQEERVKQLRKRRESLVLRAPVDAVVSDVLVATGANVREGEPVIVVMDTHVTRATAWIDESAAWQVRVGDRTALTPSDGRGDGRTGRVHALGAGIVEMPRRFWQIPGEPSFGRAVFIELDAGSGAPVPGQRYDVRFLGDAAPRGVQSRDRAAAPAGGG
jgi:multidrug resistance efflux pump